MGRLLGRRGILGQGLLGQGSLLEHAGASRVCVVLSA
jgi:hypothetical protein